MRFAKVTISIPYCNFDYSMSFAKVTIWFAKVAIWNPYCKFGKAHAAAH